MGYQLIETVTVGSGGAASIEFTGIPQDGVDLVLKLSTRNPTANAQAVISFNSGGSYTRLGLFGSGSSASGFSPAWDSVSNPSDATASTFSNAQFHVSNYTSGNAKSYSGDSVTENNAGLAYQLLTAGSWTGTAAVSSLAIAAVTGSLVQHSTASLYKITAD
jgi:hypothetical protein